MLAQKYLSLNISFNLPKKVVDESIRISHEIGESEEVYFILDGKELFPHMSLYFASFPVNNIDRVSSIVEKLAGEFTSMNLEYHGTNFGRGYLDVDFKVSDIIMRLHKKVIESENGLREGYLKPKYRSEEYLKGCNKEERMNLKRYGYRNSLKLYRPHITISKLKNAALDTNKFSEIGWEINRFRVKGLSIFKMGEHGTCVKKLVIYPFKKP